MDNNKEMSEYIEKFEELYKKMEASNIRSIATHEMHEEQLKLYRNLVVDNIELNDKRWNDNVGISDKRWSGMRQSFIAITCVILLSALGGGVAIDRSVTEKELEEEFKQKGYTTKDETLRGFGSVTNDFYEYFELKGEMTHEEAEEAKGESRKNILREIMPDYKSRSPQKTK